MTFRIPGSPPLVAPSRARETARVERRLQAPAKGVDVTDAFDPLYRAARKPDFQLPANANDYAYYLVPGFAAPGGAMRLNRDGLRALGLSDVRLATDASEANRLEVGGSVEHTAQTVARGIEALKKETGKQVVVIAHSSGAPAFQQALVNNPSLQKDVRGFVALNGSFYGTPLARGFMKLPELARTGVSRAASKLGIETQGIRDVLESNRAAFMEAHPLPSDLPALAVATSHEHGFSLLAPLTHLLRSRSPGGKSDGINPTANEVLPGRPVAFLDDTDHMQTVLSEPGSKQDPGALTAASVAYLLRSS